MTHTEVWIDPSVTVAIAIATGIAAQALARHLRVPGIVLLLATGVLLGPDVLGLLRPKVLGDSLHALVGFGVAVILFEGALNLSFKRLREQARSIRRLVTIGAVITTVGGFLAARFLLGWDWRLSILFGTLVIVTGPTVITPLIRRIRLRHRLATVLEGEGVFGDAIGALVAVVALEIVISPSGASLIRGTIELITRIGSGAAGGVAIGLLLAYFLPRQSLVPPGLENVFILSAVWLTFHGMNALLPESGIVAVIAAGVTMANFGSRQLEELREFKEQLTVLMLGMLFVLLAADVRIAEVRDLGWPGLVVVVVLMFIVRPLNVLASTHGTTLSTNERVFLMWLAPRGIVAAAVASLFAQSLTSAGLQGGNALRAMVFLVIAVTVNVQGSTGGRVARRLGVDREREHGYVILGANPLGRLMGQALALAGERVLYIDSNPQACEAAESEGFRVLYGNALSERLLRRSQLDERDGVLALTLNDEANFAFCRRAFLEFGVPRVWLPVRSASRRLTPSMLHEIDAHPLFGGPRNLAGWMQLLSSSPGELVSWSYDGENVKSSAATIFDEDLKRFMLPLVVVRDGRGAPFDETVSPRPGDRLLCAIDPRQEAEVARSLSALGWRPDTASAPSS